MLLSEQLLMQKNELTYINSRYEKSFDDLRDYKISPTIHVTQELLERGVRKWYEKKNRTTEIVDRLENLLNTFGDF